MNEPTAANQLEQVDARVKIIFTLAFILFLNLTPLNAWGGYILFLSLVLGLAVAAQVEWKVLLQRSLLSLFFITAALPLIFTDPAPMIPVHLFGNLTIQLSQPGLLHFASIAVKAWGSMVAALLLTEVTPMHDLLLGFQRLHVPRVFIAIISLMWRYLFVIRAEARSLMHARASRSASSPHPEEHHGGSLAWRAKVTGGMAGNLLLRSLERADRVYAAMLSRGYNGELPDRESKPLSSAHWALLAGLMLVLAFFFLFSLIYGAAS